MGFNDPKAARNIPLEGWIRDGVTPLGLTGENEQIPTMKSIITDLAGRVGSGRHFLVTPVIGPEAVTGSSRMKGNGSDLPHTGLLRILRTYNMLPIHVVINNNVPLVQGEPRQKC